MERVLLQPANKPLQPANEVSQSSSPFTKPWCQCSERTMRIFSSFTSNRLFDINGPWSVLLRFVWLMTGGSNLKSYQGLFSKYCFKNIQFESVSILKIVRCSFQSFNLSFLSNLLMYPCFVTSLVLADRWLVMCCVRVPKKGF